MYGKFGDIVHLKDNSKFVHGKLIVNSSVVKLPVILVFGNLPVTYQ
jgi:hypothetical protein